MIRKILTVDQRMAKPAAGVNDQQETVYSIGGIRERKLSTRGGSSSQKGGAQKVENSLWIVYAQMREKGKR